MIDKDVSKELFERRDFLKTIGATSALLPFASFASLAAGPKPKRKAKRIVAVLSKQLQWMDYDELADTVAEMGYDGIELTVRAKGHVLPENVERDLPRAVKAIRKAGLQVPMMVSDITKASDPHAEKVLKTASELGIQFYRTGYIEYDFSKSIETNIDAVKVRFKELAELNKKCNIRGASQNHRGVHFNSPLWDLWLVLREIQSEWMGSQFDILHAVVEGTNTWQIALRALAPFVNTVVVKDFYWHKVDGKWVFEYCPLGEGMVDFNAFFDLLDEFNLYTPISMQFEYNLGLPKDPKMITKAHKDHVMECMKKDLIQLRQII